MISTTDTGLGKCSVAEDIEGVLRKIEHWHQAQLLSSRSRAGTAKDSDTEFGGKAKARPCSLCRKPMSDKPARNCWLETKARMCLLRGRRCPGSVDGRHTAL